MISLLAVAATVSVGQMEMKTYPFSDPDPVPAVTTVKYPYFRYDGSTDKASLQKWQTVTLENEAIRVTIFPEIGGKVWGAVDKKTGKDFVYFNHVVKFRDIAMRGPWCSGGIEYNFGIIGHAPSCSTPVDWFTRQNPDGSVSCFLASSEYITRAWWQVEVRLAPGAENFETHTTWYNASGLEQPYYHWMNAAFATRGNPSFLFPGASYIGHDGDAHPWPRDAAGHELETFAGNAFGGPKSYHVLPGANGVYGIWWPESKVGAVHRAESYEKYGRKIWLWALSREGGIWEDLLTDEDGQYTELQSGRCFNQPRRNNHKTPFKHASFAPGSTETFTEQWGVIRDAHALDAESAAAKNLVTRPEQAPQDFDWSTPWGLTVRARQQLRERGDAAAEENFRAALAKDAFLSPALTGLAAIELRRGRFKPVHELCRRALAIDAYDAEANYLDGRAYFLEGNNVTARDRLGLAAFQPQFRAAALALVARSFLREGNRAEARAAADKALAANALEFDAMLAKILAARGTPAAAPLAQESLTRFPLFHAARYELAQAGGAEDYRAYIRNELPDQTYLDLGEWYADTGFADDALAFFAEAKGSPLAQVRVAHLLHLRGDKAAAAQALEAALKGAVAGVFPFRAGTLAALDWAVQARRHWKFDYYRGLMLAFFNLKDEAARALDRCDAADEAVAFLARASLRTGAARLKDLLAAQRLGDSWRVGRALVAHYVDVADWPKLLATTTDYVARFPNCNPLQIAHGNALLKNERYADCLNYLRNVKLLPSEHRDSGTDIWQAAEKALNPDCEPSWPENLGKGKPYADSPSLGAIPLYALRSVDAPATAQVAADGTATLTVPGATGLPHGFARFDLPGTWRFTSERGLAAKDGIEFEFLCEEPDQFSGFNVLFASEDWKFHYSVPFQFLPGKGPWRKVRLLKEDLLAIRGTPQGWQDVSLMRFYLTRLPYSTKTLTCGIRNLREIAPATLPTDAWVVLGDVTIASCTVDPKYFSSLSRRFRDALNELGMRTRIVFESDFPLEVPAEVKLVVLPYNTVLPVAAQTALEAFAARGGKLIFARNQDRKWRAKMLKAEAGVDVGYSWSKLTVAEIAQKCRQQLQVWFPELQKTLAPRLTVRRQQEDRRLAALGQRSGKGGERRFMDAHNPWGGCGGAKSWDESVKLLSECGFTDLIACFAWGATAGYASQVLAPLPELATKGDGLEQCLAACRKYGVKLHAWRCCWTTGSGSRLSKELQARLEKEGRLQVDASGKIVKDWLCPNHPENHRMHVEAMVELAKKGVDGINYDFIRYGALPERTCFCSNCRVAFEKELGRKVVNWPADVLASKELLAQWGEFRARSIGRGVKEIAARVRQECPQVEISTSGGGDGTTYRIPLGRDWLAWARAGWVDFVFLMDYADDVVSFDARIASQAKVQAGKAQLIPGLGPSCWSRRGVVGDAEAMADHIDAVRARGFNAWGVFEFDDRAFGYLPLLKQVNGIAR